MHKSDILNLLETDNLFLEKNEVRLIIENCISKERALEVNMDGVKDQFWSHFIKRGELPDYKRGDSDRLLIAPLEPSLPNMRLPTNKLLKITFSISSHTLECRVSFQKVIDHFGTILIELSFPKIINTFSRRKLVRHQMPSGEYCLVDAKTRLNGKRVTVQGRLFDLHMEGLCFFLPKKIIPKDHQDPIFLSCTPGNEEFEGFTSYGRLCYRATMRAKEDTSFTQYLYGCEFTHPSSEAIALSRYVEFIRKQGTEKKKKVNLQELIDSVFTPVDNDRND